MSTPDRIDTQNLLLEWSEPPWDALAFGFPVMQINQIKWRSGAADSDFAAFEALRDDRGARIVSCRLAHDCLRESMLLEENGFRFIEMVYHPELEIRKSTETPRGDEGLNISLAETSDMEEILAITRNAFRNERFHVDMRIDPALGDVRYCNWVKNSLAHPSQRLYILRDASRTIGFFITELMADGTCYWHLNAIAPAAQGQGYGKRAWLAMMKKAHHDGAGRIRTCITARNHRVLNLYARLGFRFSPPQMTFHWVRKP